MVNNILNCWLQTNHCLFSGSRCCMGKCRRCRCQRCLDRQVGRPCCSSPSGTHSRIVVFHRRRRSQSSCHLGSWRGTTLWMCVPSTSLFFPCLDISKLLLNWVNSHVCSLVHRLSSKISSCTPASQCWCSWADSGLLCPRTWCTDQLCRRQSQGGHGEAATNLWPWRLPGALRTLPTATCYSATI